MLQTEPEKRITIKEIKSHPYFAGYDFEKVSSEEFNEAKGLIQKKLEEIKKEKAEKKESGMLDLSMSQSQQLLSTNNFQGGLIDHMDGVSYLPVMDPTTIVLKGFLLKDNWYGNK